MTPIENYRQQIKRALRNCDNEHAAFLTRIVVGLRICSGEIGCKLRPVDELKIRLTPQAR